MMLGRIAFIGALGSAVAMIFTDSPNFESREHVRIQAHFDSVLLELRARDVSALTVSQREHRAKLVSELASYRDAGQFPHNYDRPGLVPTFIDPWTGVRCAVGHLVTSTGRGDIVERVAEADNHVYVVSLSADTAFRHWLVDNGLTLAEAARIQVPYMGTPAPVSAASRSTGNVEAAVLTLSATGLTVWNAMRNHRGERKALSIAGVATGALAVVGGNALLANGQAAPAKARFAIWTGVASTVTGVATMLPIFGSEASRVQLNPVVTPSDGEEGSRFGLTATVHLSSRRSR
jgi:hypothetical protein